MSQSEQLEKKLSMRMRKLIIVNCMLVAMFAIWVFWDKHVGQSVGINAIELPKQKVTALPLREVFEDSGVNVDGTHAPAVLADILSDKIILSKFELPELELSDEIFKMHVIGVSKELSQWVNVKELIEKYIVIVNDISQNQIITKHRLFLKPPAQLLAGEDAKGVYLSEENYHRFDQLTNAVLAVDIERGMKLYVNFKPLFKKVYDTFSYPVNYDLEDVFLKAAANVINAPVIEDRIALIKHSVGYKFANNELERLNDVEKLMIRMGPENTRKIQEKLRLIVQDFIVLSD